MVLFYQRKLRLHNKSYLHTHVSSNSQFRTERYESANHQPSSTSLILRTHHSLHSPRSTSTYSQHIRRSALQLGDNIPTKHQDAASPYSHLITTFIHQGYSSFASHSDHELSKILIILSHILSRYKSVAADSRIQIRKTKR